MDIQKVSFTGLLDRDTSFENRDSENYYDALNVESLTNETHSTTSKIPVRGNKYIGTAGEVAVQNKVIRVYIYSGDFSLSGTLYFYDQNGKLMNDPFLYPTAPHKFIKFTLNLTSTASTVASELVTSGIGGQGMDGLFGSGNYTLTPNVGGNYIDIELKGILGYDWDVEARVIAGASIPSETTGNKLNKVIIKEAYDLTLSGENNVIAGYNMLYDEYILSTPIIKDKITKSGVTGVTVLANKYRITLPAHGLLTGMNIKTSDIIFTGTPIGSPNGKFIITVIDVNTIELNEYYNITTGFTAYVSGGVIDVYTESVGEIGVAQKDLSTDLWTYTRLLRTKKFVFNRNFQPDFRVGERSVNRDSLYWVSKCDYLRNFYYKRPSSGVFSNTAWNGVSGDLDGAIQVINPNGFYTYENVGDSTKMIVSTANAILTFNKQLQVGGNIKSGNWRYAVRLLTETLASNGWTELTNPIPVFNADINGTVSDIIGNEPYYTTPKINTFSVSSIKAGLFKYVELVGVYYAGEAVEGYIIRREELKQTDTSLDIIHSGNETGMVNIDLGELGIEQININRAASMCSIDRRVVISNIQVGEERDLTTFAASIKHNLIAYPIDSTVNGTNGNLQLGEYLDPKTVHDKTGYMLNDTYRFSCELRDKITGLWSKPFWVDDIRFDASTVSPSGRRLSSFSSYDLTIPSISGYIDNVKVFCVNFVWDNNFVVDGFKINELYDTIRFLRAECVPEVLACGLGVLSVSGVAYAGQRGDGTLDPLDVYAYTVGEEIYSEYPFVSGRSQYNNNHANDNPEYPDTYTAKRNIASIYSPDITYGESLQYSSGDKILNYGAPRSYSTENEMIVTANQDVQGNFRMFSGETGKTLASSPVQYNIVESIILSAGAKNDFSGDMFGKNRVLSSVTFTPSAGRKVYHTCEKSIVLKADTNILQDSVFATNYGGYYMQYYRPLVNKYGEKESTKYVSTGNSAILNTSSSQNINVFGGDTFTELIYIRHRNPADEADVVSGFTGGISGFGGSIGFYAQSRINFHLRNRSSNQTIIHPEENKKSWTQINESVKGEFNKGYGTENRVVRTTAYSKNNISSSYLPTSNFWSDIKIYGSNKDSWRSFFPLNRRDLDLSDGEIVHTENLNGEFVTWQPKKFQRQFFNTSGTLEISNSEVLLGSGKVMSRDGTTVTNYGCSHKWSVIMGRNGSGMDIAFWVDRINNKFIKFDSNGTTPLTDIKGMRSFAANNMKWIKDVDRPAAGEGVHGVWNERKGEIIWTFKAYDKSISLYDNSDSYVQNRVIRYKTLNSIIIKYGNSSGVFINGETITGGTSGSPHTIYSNNQTETIMVLGFSSALIIGETITGGTSGVTAKVLSVNYTLEDPFQEIGIFYKSLRTTGNSGKDPSISYEYWEKIEEGVKSNYYTIVYSEPSNGFHYFTTPTPNIYLRWTDGYLSANPIQPYPFLYEERVGDYLTWYKNAAIIQRARGYVDCIINKVSEHTSWFTALRILSDIIPKKVEFKTQTEESYLNEDEFRSVEDYFESPIKNNSKFSTDNVLSLNNLRTSRLKGRWISVRVYFEVGIYQRVVNMIVKFIDSSRKINTK